MQKTYLFYDIETTGLNKALDQILQFAAIRTDMDLNEIDRHEIWIKLNNNIIPSPYASITHRISIESVKNGLNEFEAIEKIHKLINTPGTISVGYNSLGFDDEFLRFSFYRNLLPPYTHQFANQCGRMDIYPMIILYYLFKPDSLKWPEIDGKISLKLENLAARNDFNHGVAHNALVDVEATIALAKLLKQDESMWDYCRGYFDKKIDIDRTLQLEMKINDCKYGLFVNGKIGSTNHFIVPVLGLGQHQHYKNQSLWLRLDKTELSQTKVDDITNTTWCMNKKAGEPGFVLPNKERYLSHINDERQQISNDNLNWLEQNPDILAAIADYYKQFKYPVVPDVDIEAALYDIGFYSYAEQDECSVFHKASTDKKISLLNDFSNPNIRELALRILGKHFHHDISDSMGAEYQDYVNKMIKEQPIIDYRGEKKTTIKQALNDITKIRNKVECDAEQIELLKELESYCKAFNKQSIPIVP